MKLSLKMAQKVINSDYFEFTESDIRTDTERESLELLDSINKTESSLKDFYENKLVETENLEEYEDLVDKQVRSYKRASINILKSYQKVINIGDELSARWKDLRKSRKKRKIKIPVLANSEIDYAEKKSNHFAQGINLYKMIFICLIGSFAGVLIEMLWCLLRNGYIESRAGLVYGPFNLLYGAGAIALSVSLYRFRNRGGWLSFLGGMFVGSVVEYLCSWGQEALIGSRSWDYSAMPFNINGRICLLYSVFWGFLGYWWIKFLYPLVAKAVLRIPNRFGKVISWLVVVFFVVNSIVSVIAVFRWSQRLDGILPSNSFWEFIDFRFPDERMSHIFANMEF